MLGYAGLGCIIASIALACFTSRVGWLLLPGAVVGVPTTLWAILRNCDDDANNPSPFYPFEDESTWTRHEHLLEGERLPPYNPGLHAQPIRGPVSRAGMNVVCVPGTIIWALFMAPLFAALLLLRGRGDLRHRS
jgi:hypothetical protein